MDYQSLFKIDKHISYLNHAAVGMLPCASVEAMKNIINELASEGEPPLSVITEKLNSFRENIGKLISVNQDDISFVHNTTEGISIALHSIPWKSGDNIIIQSDAFPASLYVIHYCLPHVEKKYIPLIGAENYFDRVIGQIDNHTRAIIVDHVHFLSGTKLSLHRLSEIVNKYNLYFIVDGIQAVGAANIDLHDTEVHFYTAGGMKWLQGPMGTGFLYVRKNILDKLNPHHVGWLSADFEDLSSLYPIKPLTPHARRFERANFNLIGLYGLVEAIALLNKIGKLEIENIIHSKTEKFLNELNKLNCTILTPSNKNEHAGIVSFKHYNVDSKKIYEQMERNNVKCSLREGWIRISIHFYNTEDELNKVLNVVNNCLNDR